MQKRVKPTRASRSSPGASGDGAISGSGVDAVAGSLILDRVREMLIAQEAQIKATMDAAQARIQEAVAASRNQAVI